MASAFNPDATMILKALEERRASNPGTATFARLAWYCLDLGDVRRAMEICVEGVKRYPQYGTGHLVLGRCYERMGRNVEAMLEYRKALRATPDSQTVKDLLESVEKKEEEAYRGMQEQRRQKRPASEPPAGVQHYRTSTGDEDEGASALRRNRIVTPTLAEIYAKQEEYGEAIAAYRRLIEQRPLDASRFMERILELERLQSQQPDVRTGRSGSAQ